MSEPCIDNPARQSGRGAAARRLLYIAYHFPPLQGSTGVARTLAFARYLREWDWDVTVLTVKPAAYASIRAENNASIPSHVRVVRTTAFDAQRHLSILGRYPGMLAIPDKWQSWIPFGLLGALRIIRSWRPDAIISTYPIASAHWIGYLAHKLSGVPWIVDFRDPMAQVDYPPDPKLKRAFERIERFIFANAARVLVTTPGAAELYANRFTTYPRDHIVTLSNGYDPEMFNGIAPVNASRGGGPLRVLHSGLLSPEERNPEQLFQAIAELRDAGELSAERVSFLFRASGNETEYRRRIGELRLDGIVTFLPPVPYRDAIAEMMSVDALMLLQASNCNDQIPAKLYEYMYCGRPILGLTDHEGDTGKLLQAVRVPYLARLDSVPDIKRAIGKFLDDVARERAFIVPRAVAEKYSRRSLTGELASVLDAATRRH